MRACVCVYMSYGNASSGGTRISPTQGLTSPTGG